MYELTRWIGLLVALVVGIMVANWFTDFWWDDPDYAHDAGPIVKLEDLPAADYELQPTDNDSCRWILWKKDASGNVFVVSLGIDHETSQLQTTRTVRPGMTREDFAEAHQAGDTSILGPTYRVCAFQDGGRPWIGDAEGDGTHALYWIPPGWMQVIGDDYSSMTWVPTFGRDPVEKARDARLKSGSRALLIVIVVIAVLVGAFRG